MFQENNIVVLDCEVACSPDELSTGWDDKHALGLSLGGYYDYKAERITYFDQDCLWNTIRHLILRDPLIISFNGKGFDGPLMWACLRHDGIDDEQCCAFEQAWHLLWKKSYDILDEVWHVTGRDYAKGNSLDALCKANGLPQKTGHGAHAPKLWQSGRIAEVINYLQNDILITKQLAEYITYHNGRLQRQAGLVTIRTMSDVLRSRLAQEVKM